MAKPIKKTGGRKKYQATKQLDPVGNTWWENLDINIFGVWAGHPLLELVSKIETLRLQIEQAKVSGASPEEFALIETRKKAIQEELGQKLLTASLKTNTKLFEEFAQMLEWFAEGPVEADPVRTLLQIHHEQLRLSLWRNPSYTELWGSMAKLEEFNGMDGKQFRNTIKELGLNLTKEKDIKTLRDVHARSGGIKGRLPGGQKLHAELVKMGHPLVTENFLEFKHMCRQLGLGLAD